MCGHNLKCIDIWNEIHFWKYLFHFIARFGFLLSVCFFSRARERSLFLSLSLSHLFYSHPLCFVFTFMCAPQCCMYICCRFALFPFIHTLTNGWACHALKRNLHSRSWNYTLVLFWKKVDVLPLNTLSQWAILTLKDWRTISNVNFLIWPVFLPPALVFSIFIVFQNYPLYSHGVRAHAHAQTIQHNLVSLNSHMKGEKTCWCHVVVVHHILTVCPFYGVFLYAWILCVFFSVYYNFFEHDVRREEFWCVRVRVFNSIFSSFIFFFLFFNLIVLYRHFSRSLTLALTLSFIAIFVYNTFILSLSFIWSSSFSRFFNRGICESHSNYVYK